MKLRNLPTKFYRSPGKLLLIIAAMLCGSGAFAQQYFYATGTTNNTIPTNSGSNMRQILFMPTTDFPTAPSGTITKIYLKSAVATAFSFTNFTVKMGHTSLNAMVAGPWITGLTTVFTAPTFAGTPGTGNWVGITLQTPFAYNTAQNFIVEISQGGYSPGFSMLYSSTTARSIQGTSTNPTGALQDRLCHFGFDFASCTGTPTAPTITTAALTAPVCNNGTTTITATNAGAPAGISYQWEEATASSGPWSSVTGGVGATTLSYTTAALTASKWFRVKATCGANSAQSTAFQVVVGAQAPGAITGNTSFCVGASQAYSVASVFGATSYTWTLPSGWTGTSTTNSITTTPGSSAGTISVTATSACGASTASTLTVTPGTAPAQPGTVTGNVTFCPNIGLTYSVAAVTGATSYTWTLPPGWTGTSTTNSINVTTGTTAGNITVTAVNNCGTSPVRTLAVTPSTAPPALGSITGNATPCAGSSQTYSVASVPGVLSYNWSLPSGWTGSSTTNSITVVAGSNAGNVIITGSNGCSNSAPQSLAVSVPASVIPAVTIASPNTTICAGTLATFNAVAVNGGNAPSYQWRVNNTPAGANAAIFNTTTLANNDVVTLTMTSNAPCPVPASVNSNAIAMTVIPNAVPGININATTPPEICANTNVTFYSNITGGGPTPTYQWLRNNSPVGSNAPTYTASNFADNDTISCVLTTSALCPTFHTMTSNRMGLEVSPVVTPSVTIAMSPSTFVAPGQQVTFLASVTNGGTQPQYQWVKNSLDILGATNATYVTNTLGHMDKIHVRIVSSADCAFPNNVTSNYVSVTSSTSGIATTQQNGAAINLYPNPNKGEFEIAVEFEKLVNGKMQIEIVNTLGQTIYRSEDAAPASTTWTKKLTIGNVANGVYMLRLVADGKATTRRFEMNR